MNSSIVDEMCGAYVYPVIEFDFESTDLWQAEMEGRSLRQRKRKRPARGWPCSASKPSQNHRMLYPRPSMHASTARLNTPASFIAEGCVVAQRLHSWRSASVCAVDWPLRG